MSRKKRIALSELENKVMAIIWQRGTATADDVRAELDADPPLKDSTIRTILRRLEAKGYAAHRTEGRTYVWAAVVPSQSVAVDAVQGILQRFCNGSIEELLVGMVDRDVLSAEKLSELARKISQSKSSEVKDQGPTPRTKG